MDKLSSREGVLGLIFGLLVLGLGSFFLFSWLGNQKGALEREIVLLKSQQSEMSSWMQEKQMWDARAVWLAAKQMPFPGTEEASTRILNRIELVEEQHNLNITRQQLLDAKTTTYYKQVPISLQLEGDFADVIRWLHAIQQPENFLGINSLSIKNAREENKVLVEINLGHWYSED